MSLDAAARSSARRASRHRRIRTLLQCSTHQRARSLWRRRAQPAIGVLRHEAKPSRLNSTVVSDLSITEDSVAQAVDAALAAISAADGSQALKVVRSAH